MIGMARKFGCTFGRASLKPASTSAALWIIRTFTASAAIIASVASDRIQAIDVTRFVMPCEELLHSGGERITPRIVLLVRKTVRSQFQIGYLSKRCNPLFTNIYIYVGYQIICWVQAAFSNQRSNPWDDPPLKTPNPMQKRVWNQESMSADLVNSQLSDGLPMKYWGKTPWNALLLFWKKQVVIPPKMSRNVQCGAPQIINYK